MRRSFGRSPVSIRILAVMLLILILVPFLGETAKAGAAEASARPSVNGRLRFEEGRLLDRNGDPAMLRGVSTHGLTWYPAFINEDLFRQISGDWNANLIRLAMYASIYAGKEKEESYALMKKGIEAAVKADLYVLVDWHMLEKGDPNDEAEEAAEFFARVTEDFRDLPNLLFEICNEPNGEADWGAVRAYADRIIPLIREKIPDAPVIVGTPEYDRNLGGALMRPLAYGNVGYTLHFYAASHGEGLRGELEAAAEAGLPVFVTECGLSESDGDGKIDFGSAASWFALLEEKGIGYAVWNLSDKDESSAFFKPGFDPRGEIRDGDLTPAGLWVRELLRGRSPGEIPAPAAVLEKNGAEALRSRIARSIGDRGNEAVSSWLLLAGAAGGLFLLGAAIGLIGRRNSKRRHAVYDDVVPAGNTKGKRKKRVFAVIGLCFSIFFTLIYLAWRVVWSVPLGSGVAAVTGNLILLLVELLGFVEAMVLYRNLFGLREHPLPQIPDDAWPEVDVFIATYNEPVSLLKKTVNGCLYMRYPDPGKVHIWICDDNRRKEMRALAEEMGVGYFDRPDNEGAKAGNLNAAMKRTSAPYIVTFDADMIPRSDFLLKTIPYFVDVERRESGKPEGKRRRLGLLQTPQSFYDPDVFQYALYSEKRAPNEQDFFYRTIEPAKTATNSVIYGGSNTVLSRRALEDVGGFFTGSVTEDFATGLLIEAAGYLSLALPEPLASGQTPNTFRDHVKQRTRWGRGVIVTAKKLGIFRRKNLSFAQKISYWSSVIYWYSPVKNLIYLSAPLLYAVFAVPVFRCSWLELLIFWLPAFFMQDIALRLNSGNAISTKWSGIYEISVMPHLLIPVLQESMGIRIKSFKVTDKTQRRGKRTRDFRSMIPFLVFIALSLAGIVRILVTFEPTQTVSLLILLFWLVRNLYFLLMALFLVDGRDGDGEPVRVTDAEFVTVRSGNAAYEGVTTLLTEHNLTVYLDEGHDLGIGEAVTVAVSGNSVSVELGGVITGIRESRNGAARTHTVEILDFRGEELAYTELLYDRVPTLPQSLHRDFGVLAHFWQNVAYRVARTRK